MLDLRNHLYGREQEVLQRTEAIPHWRPKAQESLQEGGTPSPATNEPKPAADAALAKRFEGKNLLPDIIDPDVIWACTTCRACEEQCPVMITYVDKIVQMRRHEVMIKGDGFPSELSKPFEGMEVNGNPWNLSRMDRANWA
jgi:Fe-S oxidoreductase